ncbi:MAG: hypothetical protein C4617_05855 [Candidatus Liberibacter europaeus]|uniref:Uncharacterized protein n=1 Tax=Candidatus Liberibacter europaeus TaxID=744859 RepID=A0A2T4VW65_9HYPH|nr:hypothetical protein [Candidatus Liberibacter europaeus]PTL86015.1 MAG: hypothetical protein C4617_05855 [Candidatus Liberibacter europaeus]
MEEETNVALESIVNEPTKTESVSDTTNEPTSSHPVVDDPLATNPFKSKPTKETKSEENQTKEKSPSEEKPTEEYQIKCPEFIPADEVEAHVDAFKQAGVDPKTAQKVVDRLVAHGRENEQKYAMQLKQSLDADKGRLQKELGKEYDIREQSIARYFEQENIPDDAIKTFISTLGFEKTFRLFDHLAQGKRQKSVGDTIVKTEGGNEVMSSDISDYVKDPESFKKLVGGDPKLNQILHQTALQKAKAYLSA